MLHFLSSYYSLLYSVLILLTCQTIVLGQDQLLYENLKSLDSLVFDIGFNNCEIARFEDLLDNNFEFYHDKVGITKSKDEFILQIKENICNSSQKPIRKLVENSLEVFPLKENGRLYGAIQQGIHRFYTIATDNHQKERLTSEARFIHIWLLEKGKWELSRALSYDHHLPKSKTTIDTTLLFSDRTETERWLNMNRVPALGIGYIENGKIKETTVYGILEKGKPAPENAIFNVASLTKSVTALVALKLIDRGSLILDEPLHKYWIDPDIKDDTNTAKLTARLLLSHRSGFPNWRYQHSEGRLTFQFEPGTNYSYSGEGFEYLRKAIEYKTGQKLENLANELVFLPAGMKDTRFIWDSTLTDHRFAKWHTGDGKLYKTYKNTQANAADDLLTTVADYTRFLQYIMNGADLSTELYEEMLSEQTRVSSRKYWGFGWWVDENVNGDEDAIINGGDDQGVHTIAFILPESQKALLIFTNSDNGTDIYIPTVLNYLGQTGQAIIDVEMGK